MAETSHISLLYRQFQVPTYTQFFGLSRPLFADGIAADDAVFRSAAVERLFDELAAALARKDSVAVLSGTSGTGKTTIAAEALRTIGTRQAFAFIGQPPLTGHELLEQLLTDFGMEPYRRSRVERLQLWRQFLSEMLATDTRVCLLVENAENLSTEVLQALHTLTKADAGLSPGANVVLTTAGPLELLLTTPEMLAFNQRVRLRRQIAPLTEQETADYLEFKCRNAGVNSAAVFDDDVPAALCELTGGIIRVINNLTEAALAGACETKSRRVTEAIVLDVAEHQLGLRRMAPPAIDELLALSADLDEVGSPDADEIPTLNEFVAEPDDVDLQSISAARAALR